MPKNKEVTEATDFEQQVTAQSAGEASESEEPTQDSSERLAKLEEDLRAFAEKVEQETKARAAAEASAAEAERKRREAEEERDRQVKIRIGHQRETGPKLQELAELKKRQEQQNEITERMSRLEGLLEAMASNSLDPEALERAKAKIAQAERDRELARLRQEVQQRSQSAQQQVAPELTPAWKKQLKDEYFPEFDVDPLELTDREWHQYDSRDGEHWKEQVRAEFERRHNAKRAALTQANKEADLQSVIAAQVADAVKAQREEDAKRLAETKAELEELRKAHEETKRLAEERLNRQGGMDRDHQATASPMTPPEKTLQRDLAKLNPEALYSSDPAERAAYLKARENDKALRDRILEHARRVQAQAER
jgi:hypothetical protein